MTAYTGGMPTFTAGVKTGNADRLNQLRDLGRVFTDAWSSYSPTLTQGGTVTWNAAASRPRYIQAGKLVVVNVFLAVTGTGTAGQVIALTPPVTPAAAYAGGGSFSHFDVGNVLYCGWTSIGASTMTFGVNGVNAGHGVTQGTLTNGDTLSVLALYEAA